MLIMVYLRSLVRFFNTIDRAGDDIVDQLDWSKFVWDVDNDGGDGSPDITFDAAILPDAIVDVSSLHIRLQLH